MTFYPEAETRHELRLARPITRADLTAAFGPDIVFEESPDGGDLLFSHPFHSVRIHRRPLTDGPEPPEEWDWELWWDKETWEKTEADGDFTPPPPIAPEVLATFIHPYALELSHWSSAPPGTAQRPGLPDLPHRRDPDRRGLLRPATREGGVGRGGRGAGPARRPGYRRPPR